MAAAFDRAGFDAVDVHMSDLLDGRRDLHEFRGLAACGGFSYGDVLGAGEGWAKSILLQPARARSVRRVFRASRHVHAGRLQRLPDVVGAQGDHPGRRGLAAFRAQPQRELRSPPVAGDGDRNPVGASRRDGGSRIPIAVAHGEGRAECANPSARADADANNLIAARYVDSRGRATERYPANPNGSPDGLAALTTPDGRVTIFMPHPERVFRAVQYSWRPSTWNEDGPWMRLFRNARVWVG